MNTFFCFIMRFYLRLLKTQTAKPKYQLHKNVAFLKGAG